MEKFKKTLDEVLQNKINGLCYGNRILLPFICDIVKASVENDLIYDFSPSDKGCYYTKHDYFTEVYFLDYEDLFKVVSKYEVIKMVVIEEGKNIFDPSTHIKLALDLLENHVVDISQLGEDSLFIE